MYIHVVLEKARWEHSGRLIEKHLGNLLKVQESNTLPFSWKKSPNGIKK